ncbi:hypothetical protein [Paenibacillus lautus]|uniref:hypothetical protein n=1 Tax=Paenibacillus lautus TaxID=1401 RepID=UPI001C7CA286|nr:hypothetical protein [Paenibacillus lautus]
MTGKREFVEVLARDYLYEREQNKVWQKENGFSYGLALGKLLGTCTAFEYEVNETTENLEIIKGKTVILKLSLSQ